MRFLPFAFPLFLLSAPAHANVMAGVQIPEPSNLALFALGLAGVAIGRRFSRARRNPDDE
ncbi:MAG: PEP-CTERM sorting domain-containing protein [Sphingomonadaceae bacterium]